MDNKTSDHLLKLVKTSYSQIAEDFNITRQKPIWPELAKIAKNIDDSLVHKTVLDVGCGNGRLAELFADRNISYTGVDNCANLLGLAKSNYQTDTFAEGDILELSQVPGHNFDYVFCVAVLHHLPGSRLRLEALKQLKSKAKPDGTIVVTVWNMWSQKKLRRLIIKFAFLKLLGKHNMDFGDIIFNWRGSDGAPNSERYYHAFTNKELKKLLKQADLKLDKLYHDQYNYYLIIKKPL